MRNFKARISKLEKNIKSRKKRYKIYWADGTFVSHCLRSIFDLRICFKKGQTFFSLHRTCTKIDVQTLLLD